LADRLNRRHGPWLTLTARRGLPGWGSGPDELGQHLIAGTKDLRLAVEQTQQDLAATLGVGQDAISRLEKRSDMLLSTLRRYVEAMGGTLELVAQFPNRPPLVIDHLAPTNGMR